MQIHNRWTDSDKIFIKNNYLEMSNKEMARRLGRTETSVAHYLSNNKLLRKKPNYIGQKFNKLTIVGREKIVDKGISKYYAICECECGNKNFRTLIYPLVKGDIFSCGCRKVIRTKRGLKVYDNGFHGKKGTRIYSQWCGIIQRCDNPKAVGFKYWGGKGVKICEEWRDFMTYYNWAMENGYRDDLTVERIDVNGDYTPDNVTFVTRKQQANNRTNSVKYKCFNKELTLAEWAERPECLVTYIILYKRIKGGWNIEDALMTLREHSDYSIKIISCWGELKTIDEWVLEDRCKMKNIKIIKSRLKKGWPVDEALSVGETIGNGVKERKAYRRNKGEVSV